MSLHVIEVVLGEEGGKVSWAFSVIDCSVLLFLQLLKSNKWEIIVLHGIYCILLDDLNINMSVLGLQDEKKKKNSHKKKFPERKRFLGKKIEYHEVAFF